jgi:hypothetical protein
MDLDADSQPTQVKKEQAKEDQDQEDLAMIEEVERVTAMRAPTTTRDHQPTPLHVAPPKQSWKPSPK